MKLWTMTHARQSLTSRTLVRQVQDEVEAMQRHDRFTALGARHRRPSLDCERH